MSRSEDLKRIHDALHAAAEALRPFTPGTVDFEVKPGRGDPLTEADLAANQVLLERLPRRGEGWLSEESADDLSRLSCRRVWVVDPIDGTREFIDGIDEWCISVGLVEEGLPVAGGILNPVTGELVLGGQGEGVTYNGSPTRVLDPARLADVTVLASRSETGRGEWERFQGAAFSVRPCGSVAYKMALVAGGRAASTWTVVPKSEWDVAAGTALVRSAGGTVTLLDGTEPRFNQPRPSFPNFIAAGPRTWQSVMDAWFKESA